MENQNRLQIKQRQLQHRLAAAGADLRQIASHSEGQVLALSKKTALFAKLKEELKNSKLVRHAAHGMQNAQGLRTKLQKNAREMKQVNANLSELQSKTKQQLQNIKLLKEKIELIDKKLHLQAEQKTQIHNSREQENITEIKAVSQADNLRLFGDEQAPAVSHLSNSFVDSAALFQDAQNAFLQSRQNGFSEAAGHSNLEQAGEQQLAQDTSIMEAWKSFDGSSGVELTFQAQNGEELELNVHSDLRENIDISLASSTERYTRQLWRQKAELLDELKEAGIKVESLNILKRKDA